MEYYEVDHFVFNPDALMVLGDQSFKEVLTDNIYVIPKGILDDVLSNCVFLMLNKDKGSSAAFIPKELIEGKNVCAFYEILYSEERDEQVKMILHEIVHYVLGHSDQGLSDEEYYKQEREANALRDKWIDDWENHIKTQEEKNTGKGGD